MNGIKMRKPQKQKKSEKEKRKKTIDPELVKSQNTNISNKKLNTNKYRTS